MSKKTTLESGRKADDKFGRQNQLIKTLEAHAAEPQKRKPKPSTRAAQQLEALHKIEVHLRRAYNRLDRMQKARKKLTPSESEKQSQRWLNYYRGKAYIDSLPKQNEPPAPPPNPPKTPDSPPPQYTPIQPPIDQPPPDAPSNAPEPNHPSAPPKAA